MMDTVSNLTLPHSLAMGTPASPSDFCDAHLNKVYRFAALVCRNRDEAADLAQDAMERALRKLSQFDPDRGSMDAWLWRIVQNAAADAGRVRARQFRIISKLVALQPRGVEATYIGTQFDDGTLTAAIRNLPTRDRELLALRYGGDLSWREIGELLNLGEAAACVAGGRALAKLRRTLEGEERRD